MDRSFEELKCIDKYIAVQIKDNFNRFAASELIVSITYKSGLKVEILKILNNFIITYTFKYRSWNSNCFTVESAIDNVKSTYKILKDTKVIPE